MATGNAVKGREGRPPAKYPRQLIVMVAERTVEQIEREALRRGVSKSEAARAFLEAGISSADGGIL